MITSPKELRFSNFKYQISNYSEHLRTRTSLIDQQTA